MVDGDRPYLLPLSFALDGDDLVLHSARDGRKLEVLRRNPQVCFEVEDGVALVTAEEACDYTFAFRTIVGSGEVEFVDDPAERARLLALFGPRYGAPLDLHPPPPPEVEVKRTQVLRVRVRELAGKRSP
jgi:nitroimidazol reductase NimA-like FMN-containing flavoprotein (pyridoxamine 5'-phosphate oxidase superfamily)